jgi:hypothetical protein
MQLDHALPGEALAYLKVLDNMAIILDHEQIEKATSGHWRNNIAEVVSKIVACHGTSCLVVIGSQLANTNACIPQSQNLVWCALLPVFCFALLANSNTLQNPSRMRWRR